MKDSLEVVKHYSATNDVKRIAEYQKRDSEQADILQALLRRQMHDRCAKKEVYEHRIDDLIIGAVANPHTDTIDGIVYDLKFAVSELENVIALLKKIQKAG